MTRCGITKAVPNTLCRICIFLSILLFVFVISQPAVCFSESQINANSSSPSVQITITISPEGNAITSALPNWVVGRRRGDGVYYFYKLAETGDIEGYERDDDSAISYSNNLNRVVTYTALDENEPIEQIMYYYAATGYADGPARGQENLALAGEVLSVGDTVTGEMDGKNYTYYIAALDNTTEDAEEPTLSQWLYGYVEYQDDLSVLVTVHNTCASEDEFVEDEALVAAFEKAMKALTMEPVKE